MNLESQVASLKLCKRLNELEISNGSEFYWAHDKNCDNEFVWHDEFNHVYQDYPEPENICSAFTVAELGMMLPERFDNFRTMYIKYEKLREESTGLIHWICSYNEDGGYNMDIVNFETADINEANARAKMLIHLIENGLIKVDHVNRM